MEGFSRRVIAVRSSIEHRIVLKGSPIRMDAIGGDFDLGNATEGEQKLYKVLGRLLRGLFHDVANSVGDRTKNPPAATSQMR